VDEPRRPGRPPALTLTRSQREREDVIYLFSQTVVQYLSWPLPATGG
jgi:hypothetical protein